MSPVSVPGYDLEAPSLALVVASLARYVDSDEATALLAAARQLAGLADDHDERAETLLRLVDALEHQGDVAATCAKGLRVRIKSFQILAAHRGG